MKIMWDLLNNQFTSQLQNIQLIIFIINAFLHLIFAGAVAKDASNVIQKPVLVSAAVWAFATLLGGVFVAIAYWFIHHSTLTRPIGKL